MWFENNNHRTIKKFFEFFQKNFSWKKTLRNTVKIFEPIGSLLFQLPICAFQLDQLIATFDVLFANSLVLGCFDRVPGRTRNGIIRKSDFRRLVVNCLNRSVILKKRLKNIYFSKNSNLVTKFAIINYDSYVVRVNSTCASRSIWLSRFIVSPFSRRSRLSRFSTWNLASSRFSLSAFSFSVARFNSLIDAFTVSFWKLFKKKTKPWVDRPHRDVGLVIRLIFFCLPYLPSSNLVLWCWFKISKKVVIFLEKWTYH